MNSAYIVRATDIVPLFILMGQKEVLHLLSAEVDLVLIVAFDRLSLIHRIIQGNQELLEALHDGRGRTQIHVMDVTKPYGSWREKLEFGPEQVVTFSKDSSQTSCLHPADYKQLLRLKI